MQVLFDGNVDTSGKAVKAGKLIVLSHVAHDWKVLLYMIHDFLRQISRVFVKYLHLNMLLEDGFASQ